MIHIRQDSTVYEMLTFLSYVGEFPYASISLLGRYETYRKTITKMGQDQTYRIPDHRQKITGRLLNISGGKDQKTIRLSQKGLEVLHLINPDAGSYYDRVYGKAKISSSAERIDRAHRLAETAALFRLAGVETSPFQLPPLQMARFDTAPPEHPVFYTSHELKHIDEDGVNKVAFSRITGMLLSSGGCYAIYNSRDTRMEWNGRGEGKVLVHLKATARMNAGQDGMSSAIMLASDYSIAQPTLAFLGKVNRVEYRFDEIYDHLHFIPMNSFGVRLIKLLTLPDWNETFLDLLFDEDERARTGATFCYDATRDDAYVLCFLDSDLFRLKAFWDTVRVQKYKASVICFPEQVPFLRSYLRDKVSLQTVTMDMVENAIYEGGDSNE